MERDARYALVGLLSVVLMVGLAAFVIWLAGKQFSQSFDQYVVDFKGPVRGLSSGGEVFFNGIKVGEVTRLSLNSKDPNRVLARIRITSTALAITVPPPSNRLSSWPCAAWMTGVSPAGVASFSSGLDGVPAEMST